MNNENVPKNCEKANSTDLNLLDLDRTRSTIFSDIGNTNHENRNVKTKSIGEEKERKSRRHSFFNKKFFALRQTLNLAKISRKYQFDSLLKKVKAKVYKIIYEALKKCLIDVFKLPRLPQVFITNIKIDFNKHYLNKTILEIYKENNIIMGTDHSFISQYIKSDKKDIFIEFISLSFIEVYIYYITSRQFIRDQEKISKKEGDNLSQLFTFIATNFIEYYTLSKGNKPKTKICKNVSKLFKVEAQMNEKEDQSESFSLKDYSENEELIKDENFTSSFKSLSKNSNNNSMQFNNINMENQQENYKNNSSSSLLSNYSLINEKILLTIN